MLIIGQTKNRPIIHVILNSHTRFFQNRFESDGITDFLIKLAD